VDDLAGAAENEDAGTELMRREDMREMMPTFGADLDGPERHWQQQPPAPALRRRRSRGEPSASPSALASPQRPQAVEWPAEQEEPDDGFGASRHLGDSFSTPAAGRSWSYRNQDQQVTGGGGERRGRVDDPAPTSENGEDSEDSEADRAAQAMWEANN